MRSSDRWMAALTAALTILSVQPARAADAGHASGASVQMTRQDPANSPVTLRVETPTGDTAQLTYRPAQGWNAAGEIVDVGQSKAGFAPHGAAMQDDPTKPGRNESVFIDGPTGYTYVWNRTKGWTFVGRLIDRNE